MSVFDRWYRKHKMRTELQRLATEADIARTRAAFAVADAAVILALARRCGSGENGAVTELMLKVRQYEKAVLDRHAAHSALRRSG